MQLCRLILPAWLIVLGAFALLAQEERPPTAVEQLRERFAVMEKEVARLRADKAADADKLSARLEEFRAWLKGPYEPPRSDEPEMHMVGVYEGANPVGVRDVGNVNVRITYSVRPIILVLCAYNPVLWNIEVGKDVRIARVIVGGYHRQDVKGLPGGVETVVMVHEDSSREYFYAYQSSSGDYLDSVRKLRRLTRSEPATFQGAYRPPETFSIGPESENWRAEHLLRRSEGAYTEATRFERERVRAEMLKIRFAAVHATFGEHGQAVASTGDFTAVGPLVSSLKPLPERVHLVAVDPQGPTWYGLDGHEAFEIDMAKRTKGPIKLAPGAEKPRWNSPRGIVFDTGRRLLIVAANRRLFAFDPNTRQWSIHARMEDDVLALAYSPRDGVFHALLGSAMPKPGIYLGTLDAAGKVVSKMPLSVRLLAHQREGTLQLARADNRLVILNYGFVRDGNSRFVALDSRSHVVDPQTGNVLFSAPIELVAETAGPPTAADFDKVRFQALHRESQGLGRGTSALADFTLAGPIQGTLQPLPEDIRAIVKDATGPAYYGLGNHRLLHVHLLAGGGTTPLLVDPTLPELSWPCGMTFDSKRRRVVVCSLGGEGFLYGYEADKKQWTLLGSMCNVDAAGLGYCADEDAIYSLSGFGGDREATKLSRYNAEGALLKVVSLSEPIAVDPHAASAQLVFSGRSLIIINQLRDRDPNNGQPLPGGAEIRVVNPATGQVLFKGPSKPHAGK